MIFGNWFIYQMSGMIPGKHSDLSEIKELIHSGQYMAI